MATDICHYERLCELCDEELVAADQAESKDARIEHLEQAFRFAQKASREKEGALGRQRNLAPASLRPRNNTFIAAEVEG